MWTKPHNYTRRSFKCKQLISTFLGRCLCFQYFAKLMLGFFSFMFLFFSKMIFFLPCCCLRCNGLSVFRERKYFTVISKISAFSILEYLETCRKQETNIQLSYYTVTANRLWPSTPNKYQDLTSFFMASNTRLLSSLRLSLILARRIFSINGFLDCERKEKRSLLTKCNLLSFLCKS